jgi:hypothetical protein
MQGKDPNLCFTVGASMPPSGRFAVFLRWLVQKDAPTRFAGLLRSPLKLERLYGLLGLWLTDPAEFDKALPAFKRDKETITEISADSPKDRTVAELATDRDRLGKPLTTFPRYAKKP